MFAYGDIGQCRDYGPRYGGTVKERIAAIRVAVAEWPEIRIPTTLNLKNPAHPMNWRRQFQMEGVIKAVNQWASRSHSAK
jgi:hypothetical protein